MHAKIQNTKHAKHAKYKNAMQDKSTMIIFDLCRWICFTEIKFTKALNKDANKMSSRKSPLGNLMISWIKYTNKWNHQDVA